jgi:hypothetical protein
VVWYKNIDSAGYSFVEWLKKYKYGSVETFRSDKRTVTIDRRGVVPIAYFNQKADSIDVLVKENTYWRWLSEHTTITQQKPQSFFDGITLIQILKGLFIAVCLVLTAFVAKTLKLF